MRAHLEAHTRRTGRVHEKLCNPPRLDAGIAHLWPAFLDLHRTRGGGMGPAPISFAELDAWQRCTRSELAAWELRAIRRADEAWLSREAERARE